MCSHCGQARPVKVAPVAEAKTAKPQPLIVKASKGDKKVKLRYYGGGMGYTSMGCHSCGGGGKYALKTSETIQFASDDAPGGWFSKRFDTSYDYYVTEKQAEYLLTLTYSNAAGQIVHKFKKID